MDTLIKDTSHNLFVPLKMSAVLRVRNQSAPLAQNKVGTRSIMRAN